MSSWGVSRPGLCVSHRAEEVLRKRSAQGTAVQEEPWGDEGAERGADCKMPVSAGVLRATGSIVFARDCKIGVPIKAPHKKKKELWMTFPVFQEYQAGYIYTFLGGSFLPLSLPPPLITPVGPLISAFWGWGRSKKRA